MAHRGAWKTLDAMGLIARGRVTVGIDSHEIPHQK
jgi:hypothetical protein